MLHSWITSLILGLRDLRTRNTQVNLLFRLSEIFIFARSRSPDFTWFFEHLWFGLSFVGSNKMYHHQTHTCSHNFCYVTWISKIQDGHMWYLVNHAWILQKRQSPQKFEGGLDFFYYGFPHELKRIDVTAVTRVVSFFCTMLLLFVSAFF